MYKKNSVTFTFLFLDSIWINMHEDIYFMSNTFIKKVKHFVSFIYFFNENIVNFWIINFELL